MHLKVRDISLLVVTAVGVVAAIFAVPDLPKLRVSLLVIAGLALVLAAFSIIKGRSRPEVPFSRVKSTTFGGGASGNQIGRMRTTADQAFGDNARDNRVDDLDHRPHYDGKDHD